MSLIKTITVIIIIVLMALWGYLMGSCLMDFINEPEDGAENEVGNEEWLGPIFARMRPMRRIEIDDDIWAEHVIFPNDPRPEMPHNAPANATERVDNNFARMEAHNDDPQNVHNHTVLIHISRKYARLEELDAAGRRWTQQFDISYAIDQRLRAKLREIREYIADMPNDRKRKIEAFLTEVCRGGTITLHNQIVKEGWLFSMIWDRINCTDNLPMQANLREMFITQILEAVIDRGDNFINIFNGIMGGQHQRAEYRTVCLNGRVGQMMSCFINMDADPLLAEPIMDEKEIVNAAYVRAHNVFMSAMEADPAMKELYNADENSLTPDQHRTLNEFIMRVQAQIDSNLRSTYIDMLGADKLQEVIANAKAGIV